MGDGRKTKMLLSDVRIVTSTDFRTIPGRFVFPTTSWLVPPTLACPLPPPYHICDLGLDIVQFDVTRLSVPSHRLPAALGSRTFTRISSLFRPSSSASTIYLRHYFVAGKRNTIIKGKNVRASYDETTKKFISQNVYVQLQPDTGITKIIRYLNNTIYIYVSNRTYLYLYIHVYMYKC